MKAEGLAVWIGENGTGERILKRVNGIEWVLVTMVDGWVAIFRKEGGELRPVMQAASIDKAMDYIGRFEPTPARGQRLA